MHWEGVRFKPMTRCPRCRTARVKGAHCKVCLPAPRDQRKPSYISKVARRLGVPLRMLRKAIESQSGCCAACFWSLSESEIYMGQHGLVCDSCIGNL